MTRLGSTMVSMKKLSPIKKREALWAYMFLAIPVLWFLVIRVIPTLFTFNISLREWSILVPAKRFVGLKNYEIIFSDPTVWKAFHNTVLLTVLRVPLELTLGFCLALLLQSIRRGRALFRTVYFTPYVTPIVASAIVWVAMYNRHYGFFNSILGKLGFRAQPFLLSPQQALYCVSTVSIWHGLGFSVVVLLAGLEAIPMHYYEAARIDGASGWQMFWRITLPLLNPTLVFLLVVTTISSMGTFALVRNMSYDGMGGPLNSTKTLVLLVYLEAFKHFRLGTGAAITVVYFLLVLFLALGQMWLVQRKVEY